MPKVSVTIPCFNSSNFIRETLESVISQTYGDLEIIVMDDGSTDGTREIVASFRDKRIKYLYKDNEGLSETRNKSIAASSGEYIAFLDHDDLWLPEKLEKQMKLFVENDDTGLVFSDSYIEDSGTRTGGTYFSRCRPRRGRIFPDYLFDSSNFIPLSTVVMKRSAFDNVGLFKKEFRIGEEYDLFLRAAERYVFDYCEMPLAVYRIHGGNSSERKDIFVKEAFDILEFWREKKPDIFIDNKKYLNKKADLFAVAAAYSATCGRLGEAIENFDNSLKVRFKSSVFIKKYLLKVLGCKGYAAFDNLLDEVRRRSG